MSKYCKISTIEKSAIISTTDRIHKYPHPHFYLAPRLILNAGIVREFYLSSIFLASFRSRAYGGEIKIVYPHLAINVVRGLRIIKHATSTKYETFKHMYTSIHIQSRAYILLSSSIHRPFHSLAHSLIRCSPLAALPSHSLPVQLRVRVCSYFALIQVLADPLNPEVPLCVRTFFREIIYARLEKSAYYNFYNVVSLSDIKD